MTYDRGAGGRGLRLSDLLGKHISYYPELARAVGGIKPSLLLSQLVYWTGRQKDPDGWIYKTHEEFEQELAMTRREQDSARETLLSQKLIDCELRGWPAKIHYRVNFESVNSLAESANQNEPHRLAETANLSLAESANQDATKAPNYIKNNRLLHNNTNKDQPSLNPFVKKKTDPIIVNGWEQFWNLYPKKTEKVAAAKAWQKLKPDLVLQTAILTRLKKFIALDWMGTEKAYIPNPATWLNKRKWEDEIVNPPARNGNGYHPPEDERPRPTLKDQLREKGMMQ